MNNTLSRFACSAILFSTAGISIYLTYMFMYNLGMQAGMAPILFAILGVTLDITKTISPALAVGVANRSPITALLLSALSILLIGVSIAASMSAIESSITGATTESREFQQIERQLAAYEKQISNLEVLAATQLDANQITRASKTQESITTLNNKIGALLDQQTNLVPDNFLSKHGEFLTIGISVILELVSVIMTLTLSKLSPKNSGYTETHSQTPSVNHVSPTPVITRTKPVTLHTTVKQDDTEAVLMAKEITDTQLRHEIKSAILGQLIKPSHRAIRNQFKVGQEKIKSILDELHNDGHLEPYNNGYRLRLA